ncbi:MAG TPA: carbohydrate ABC transporter permease [Propionicimonas sp.]|nr:carbohydrate ABC transporter permease [Propionicimonas sp.]
MARSRNTAPVEVGLNYVVLLGMALVSLWPIVSILAQAFGPSDASMDPGGLHLENFALAWDQGQFSSYMLNSVLVSVTVVLVSVALSVPAGYAFGTMTFRGSTWLFYLFLFGIMVPTEAILVPLFFDLRQLHLVNTVVAVAGPQVAQSIAFGTYWMRTYFRSADRAITEAAIIDGAAPRQVLWRVQAPIARPAILTLVVLIFMWTWNEFLIPLVMSPTGTLRTAPLGLAFFQGQHVTNYALMGAAAVTVAAPVVLVYLFAQRYFIAGMTEGAVK